MFLNSVYIPKNNKRRNRLVNLGFSVVEILIGAAIIAGGTIGLLGVYQRMVKASLSNTHEIKAMQLAEEGLEAVRSLRDTGWAAEIDTLTIGTPYYITFDGLRYNPATTQSLVDGAYRRTVLFEDVYRKDADDDIVDVAAADPKTLDPDTLQATVTVEWGLQAAEVLSAKFDTDDAPTPDEDGIGPGDFPASSGDGNPAQGFTVPAGTDINVEHVELFLRREPATTPSDIFLEIYSGTHPNDVLVGTSVGFLNAAGFAESAEWISFDFSPGLTLSASTKYYLRLRSNPASAPDPGSGIQGVEWAHEFGDLYTGGDAWELVDSTLWANGISNAGEDQLFRVYNTLPAPPLHSLELSTYITDLFDN